MAKLVINNFSCIDQAAFKLSNMTALIGPQASGKSVISKMVYFFYDILAKQRTAIEEGKSFDVFMEDISLSFKKWFPPSAWGERKFLIEFEAGPFSISVTRIRPRKVSHDKIRLQSSDYFAEHYEYLLKSIQSSLERAKRSRNEELNARMRFELSWHIQNASAKKLKQDLGADYIEDQIFVPAGRSFFTSFGKAVTAFEQGGLLDPVTVRFGRLFAFLREDFARDRIFFRSHQKRPRDDRRELMHQLFGGEIKFERDREYVKTQDGRVIPFSILSSGQQELLPLWMALDYITFSRFNMTRKRLVYIEEPEAHLFPTAQSVLIEYLAAIVSSRQINTNMLITTHSPYLLAKLNNLLKAGKLANKYGRTAYQNIGAVIKREAWLPPKSTTAYAIRNGNLIPIMDEDGLIDAAYLDEVSGEISKEFLHLLEIETQNEHRKLSN